MTTPTTMAADNDALNDIDGLIERWHRLRSCRAVAREIGRSHDAVSNKLRDKVPLRKVPKLDIDHAVKRWNKGDSIAEIAHEAGMRRSTIRTRIRNEGWRVPKGDWIAVRSIGNDILAILKAIKEGHNPRRYYQKQWGLNYAMDATIELGLIRQDPHGNPKVTSHGTSMYSRHLKDKPLELTEAAVRDIRQRERAVHHVQENE